VNLTNVGAGGGRSDRSFQQITLRGFVPSTANSTLTSTFIDGVPVASPTAVAAVHDPARVEILKGPQAAYFGRNTFAGAINVVNKQPGEVLGGNLAIMGGSRSNIDLQGSVDGPLFNSDVFGFRLSGRYFQKDGSYDNAAAPGSRLGDQETRTLSFFVSARPTENFTARLFALYSEDDDGPSVNGVISAYEVRANNGGLNYPHLSGNTAGTVFIANSSNCLQQGLRFGDGRAFGPLPTDNARVTRQWFCGSVPNTVRRYSPAQNILYDNLAARSMANPAQRVVAPGEGAQGYGLVREYQHAHLNLEYVFGDSGFTLSSATGINDEFYSEIADLDNSDTSLLSNLSNPGNANPNLRSFFDFIFAVERESFDFSQELRLSYDKEGKFNGVLGVSMIDTNVWNNLINISQEVLSGAVRNDLVSPTFVTQSRVENKAVFFGGTYKFTDSFRLSVEGRYQEDNVIGPTSSSPMGVTISATAAALQGLRPGFYGPLTTLVEATYKKFLPRVIAQYDFNEDVMGYASFSKGINVGTNTFNTAFLAQSRKSQALATELGIRVLQKPEQMTNYELGLKGRFLDGRLQLQSALYHAIWTDQLNNRSAVQLDTVDPVTNPDGIGTLQLVSGAANTGEVAMQGLEVEVRYLPIANLELSIAGAYTDTDIRSFTDPTISQISGLIGDDFKGKHLPLTSQVSGNFGVQYGGAVSRWDDSSWFARADWSYKGKQYLDQSNLAWIDGRSQVNLRGGIQRGALGLEVFVLNALDDDNYVAGFQGGIIAPAVTPSGAAESYVIVGLPELRTYGARLAYKF
jgi:iron complex outermembrane receptor protein